MKIDEHDIFLMCNSYQLPPPNALILRDRHGNVIIQKSRPVYAKNMFRHDNEWYVALHYADPKEDYSFYCTRRIDPVWGWRLPKKDVYFGDKIDLLSKDDFDGIYNKKTSYAIRKKLRERREHWYGKS